MGMDNDKYQSTIVSKISKNSGGNMDRIWTAFTIPVRCQAKVNKAYYLPAFLIVQRQGPVCIGLHGDYGNDHSNNTSYCEQQGDSPVCSGAEPATQQFNACAGGHERDKYELRYRPYLVGQNMKRLHVIILILSDFK